MLKETKVESNIKAPAKFEYLKSQANLVNSPVL